MSDLILGFLKQYGFQALPTLLLGLLCWHHLRTLSQHRQDLADLAKKHDEAVKAKATARAATFTEKDAEIHRLQEARLEAVETSYKRAMDVAQEANALNREMGESMQAVATRLEDMQRSLPPPRRH